MKKQTKSITVSILEVLSELINIAGSLAELAFDRKAAYRHLTDRTGDRYSKIQLTRYFRNLERQGYLKTSTVKGQNSIEFTNKAKLKILDKICDNVEVDGKNRFVSFDIPEPLRTKRNQFRRTIKKLGFKQIQKSLWVVDKNIGQLVELAAYEYGVEKYVIYIVAERTDIDGVIKKMLHNKR
jgi:DNA-binding transcriptional regulator PaaX